MIGALGRRTPTDFRHVSKFPITAASLAAGPVPGVLGINWYPEFDQPFKRTDGHYYVRPPAASSRPRGGHCVALKPIHVADGTGWWDFYNQGREGACVGFGSSRAMSLFNRKRYFARWLWDQAKATDEFPDTNPGDDNGTTVRAAMEILRTRGHVAWRSTYAPFDDNVASRDALKPDPAEGIAAYRWATSVDDMLRALGYADLGFVDVINSWGRDYPHLVRFPVEALERVFGEDGEFAIPTDR